MSTVQIVTLHWNVMLTFRVLFLNIVIVPIITTTTTALVSTAIKKMCWSVTVDFWTTCVRISHDGHLWRGPSVRLWKSRWAHRLMWQGLHWREHASATDGHEEPSLSFYSLSHIASSPPPPSPPGLLLLRCSTECCSTMLSTTALFRLTSIMVRA